MYKKDTVHWVDVSHAYYLRIYVIKLATPLAFTQVERGLHGNWFYLETD